MRPDACVDGEFEMFMNLPEAAHPLVISEKPHRDVLLERAVRLHREMVLVDRVAEVGVRPQILPDLLPVEQALVRVDPETIMNNDVLCDIRVVFLYSEI